MQITRNAIALVAGFILAGAGFLVATQAATVELASVIAEPVSRTIDLPAETFAFFSVSVRAKVAGYIERVVVDRGSVVHEGAGAGAIERAGDESRESWKRAPASNGRNPPGSKPKPISLLKRNSKPI